MNFIFHRIWDNPSHWRTPSFFRGVGWNHQPDYSWIPHRMMLQLPEIPVIYSGYFYGEIMGWRNSHRNGAISLTYHWYFGLPNGSLLKIPWLNLLGIILPEKIIGKPFSTNQYFMRWDRGMLNGSTHDGMEDSIQYIPLVGGFGMSSSQLTHSDFSEGRAQPPTSQYIYIYIHTYLYIYIPCFWLWTWRIPA